MYATSHKVVNGEGAEAVHSFVHEHGRIDWPVDVSGWPESNPGKLRLSEHRLAVGGNEVRSYLDVICSDETSMENIQTAIESINQDFSDRSNPLIRQCGTVTVRFGLEQELLVSWASELEVLSVGIVGIVKDFQEHMGTL